MKYLIGLVLAGSLLSAAPEPEPRQAREVRCDDKVNIPISVNINTSTVITMPEGEYIFKAFGGDDSDWIIGDKKKVGDGGSSAMPTRFLPIKPKVKGAHTVITLVGNGGTNCAFDAIEGGPAYDTRIFIEGSGEDGSTPFEKVNWIPANEAKGYKLQEEQADKRADEAVKKAQEEVTKQVDAYKVQYPATLRFPYVIDQGCAARLNVEQIWHDDRFTYIRARNQDAPVVFGKDEGKPSLIQSSLDRDLYVTNKILTDGYFLIGKDKKNKCEFYDKGGKR